jgi:hypothetical protein
MSNVKIGIPLHGKMSARALHAKSFRDSLSAGGFQPLYFLSPHYYRSFEFDPSQYFELQAPVYDQLLDRQRFLQALKTLRRFVVRTDTTDLRFRETIEAMLFESSTWKISRNLFYMDVLRNIPNLGSLLLWIESAFFPTHVHDQQMREQNIKCVLTPGMGNFGFWNEGLFALEAQRLGMPVFAAVTNYDNIVNMGFRGFMPDCLAVWSKQMADEAMQLHRIPARKIEITGPVQYDRFMQPLPMDRDAFLTSLGLDPKRKTIVYAGGVNITRYFEIYRLFIEQREQISTESFNFIMRPYPHVKLQSSPGWQILEKLFKDAGVCISNPGSIDAGGDRTEEMRRDLAFEEGPDELSYLLRYSDLLINNFSTISLEAAICDLPVVHMGYDSYTFGHRFNTTAAFQQRQTHNRRKLRLAASKVAKNESELIEFTSQYLTDRNLDKDARRTYALSECGDLDGLAGVRLAEMIKNRL